MEVQQLSRGSAYLLKIASPAESDQVNRCQNVAQDALLGTAGIASVGTEVFWLPVSLSQGSNGVQYFLAEGMFVSMVFVKFVCYRDLIGEVFHGRSEDELKALGRRTGTAGTALRLAGSFVTSMVVQFPLAWQVAHNTGSLWKGAIGGYGDIPVSWFSVDHELRSLINFEGYTRPQRQLNLVRSRLLAEIDETMDLCNHGEICPKCLVKTLDELNGKDQFEALGQLIRNCCHPVDQSENRWITAGRYVMDTIGAGLTGSHLWMMGALAKNGTENFTGSETAGYLGGTISAIFGFGVAVESIGTAPRNFYDAAIGWRKGERPFFLRMNKVRSQLLVLALWHSAWGIASALDGADQTTTGVEREIQRPATSIGLSFMSYWGWMYVINSGLREGARRAPDKETRELAAALDRLEDIKGATQDMALRPFAKLLLELPDDKRQELLLITGDSWETRLSENQVREMACLPQKLELDEYQAD